MKKTAAAALVLTALLFGSAYLLAPASPPSDTETSETKWDKNVTLSIKNGA